MLKNQVIFYSIHLKKKIRKLNIFINSGKVEAKPACKYLGVFLDCTLSWKNQIHYINLKLSKGIGILSKVRHFVPKNLLRTIFYAFVQPHIDYAIDNWSCASDSLIDSISRKINKAIRILSFVDNKEPVQPLFKNLKILSLHKHINLNIGKLMWKLKNKVLPKCILDIFSCCFKSSHRNEKLYIPLGRTQFKTRFIVCRGPIFWNNLPQNIKDAKSLDLFTKKLKKYLLNQ